MHNNQNFPIIKAATEKEKLSQQLKNALTETTLIEGNLECIVFSK